MVWHGGPLNGYCKHRDSRSAVKAISCPATRNPGDQDDAVRSGRKSSECQPNPEYLHRIEGDLRIEAALNVGGLAETVLLAQEQEITDGVAIAPQCIDHHFGLVGRDHRVLGALEKDDRL